MPDFTFVHAADIHLDSPLRGLYARDSELAHLFVQASRKAYSALIDAAIEAEARFLIIAGDLYDGDWKDYSTGQFFVRETARLTRAGGRVFLIRGNHDATSEISRRLPLPEGVHELSVRSVQSIELAELETVIHGRGFAQRQVQDNVALEFPPARPGWFNIGVLHTSLTGRAGHNDYAPCSVDDLLRTGYQYWALGHVHAREVVHEDPPIVFPGNLQGRHIRETGPKGATLVTVENHRVAGLEALVLDAARWEQVAIDVGGCTDETALHDAVRAQLTPVVAGCDGRPLAVRIRLHGATGLHAAMAAHREQFRQDLQAIAAELAIDVLVEDVRLETAMPATAALAVQLADLEDAFRTVLADPAFEQALREDLAAIRQKAPKEVLDLLEEDERGPDVKRLLAAARDLVLARLEPEAGTGAETGDGA